MTNIVINNYNGTNCPVPEEKPATATHTYYEWSWLNIIMSFFFGLLGVFLAEHVLTGDSTTYGLIDMWEYVRWEYQLMFADVKFYFFWIPMVIFLIVLCVFGFLYSLMSTKKNNWWLQILALSLILYLFMPLPCIENPIARIHAYYHYNKHDILYILWCKVGFVSVLIANSFWLLVYGKRIKKEITLPLS